MSERLRLCEPSGTRSLELPCWVASHVNAVSAERGDRLILVPGLAPDERLMLSWEEGGLYLDLEGDTAVRCNGIGLRPGERRRLRYGDVLAIGTAHLRIEEGSPPSIEIVHLEGNETIEPAQAARGAAAASDFGADEWPDEWIDRTDLPSASEPEVAAQTNAARKVPGWWWGAVLAVSLLFGVALFLGQLERVDLKVSPSEARVSIDGVGWRAGDSLLAWPGNRRVRASLPGFEPVQRDIVIRRGEPLAVDLRLVPSPGILQIDTAGVVATAYVDGAEVGPVPGDLSVREGERTLTLRAEKYLEEVVKLDVKGRGIRQPVAVTLRPSWGALEVSATRQALLEIEGQVSSWELPATIELPAGMYRLTVSAPNTKKWQSAVLVEAGRTVTIGPLELGAPDAQLRITSRPAGAAIMVGGAFRGQTPSTIDLAPGIEHDISLILDGYRTLDRRVRAESGRRLDLGFDLPMIPVSLQIEGQPQGAEIWLGTSRLGVAPLTTELPARRHTLEMRKAGSTAQRIEVDLSSAVPRRVDYRLVPEGKSADWTPPTAEWRGQSGTVMRLVTGGSFLMGSDRREQGRRANEYQRRITLSRPFYLAVHEVTNAEFRRFKSGHSSGLLGKRTLDLDSFAVSGVSWQDAVQYCNWLSERDGLAPAYEQRQGRWVLREPVTTGYRLPTEAEWEFVARHERPGAATRRYEWGNSLPPPRNFANLAGDEVKEELPKVLPSWQDDYPVVAPPGRFPANAFGIFDMSGNVSEWLHDAYSPTDPVGSTTDPLGPASGTRHVVKGASWRTHVYTDLRVGWREGVEGTAADLGFRVARYAE